MDEYFANRRAKGFNVIQGPILHTEVDNFAGVANTNPSAPNAAWFAHIDYIVAHAAAHVAAALDRGLVGQIAFGVHAGRTRCASGSDIEHERQRLVVDRDQADRVLGDAFAFRGDRGHLLTGEARRALEQHAALFDGNGPIG